MKYILCLLFATLATTTNASLIYVPPKLDTAHARMIVAIHGCLQSSEIMAHGSGFNQAAEKQNLVVLYPQLPPHSQAMDCWRWYSSENQSAQSGELYDIYHDIQFWKAALGIAAAPVYLTGISSGAATVAGLLACYPGEFAGGAMHSGIGYGMASNSFEALPAQKMAITLHDRSELPCNPRNYHGAVMTLQGTADHIVAPANAERIMTDFLGPLKGVTTDTRANGLKYKQIDFIDNKILRGREILIQDLGHAWSGGNLNLRHTYLEGPNGLYPTKVPFFADSGPDATHLILEFFSQTREWQ
jgi:poly(hydroxyalkanoate) depolymerase family esterase